jgi:hypothetical protein
MAQQLQFTIGGRTLPRVKYGDESGDWGASQQPCSSCGVSAGEIHHAGCYLERCPACGGQAMSCRCDYQESFARRPITVARQNFYKFFYLALMPMTFVGLLLWWIPHGMPFVVCLGIALGIPAVLVVAFWRKIGDMELAEAFITTPKQGPP